MRTKFAKDTTSRSSDADTSHVADTTFAEIAVPAEQRELTKEEKLKLKRSNQRKNKKKPGRRRPPTFDQPDKMATMPMSSTEGLLFGGKFGKHGQNTPPTFDQSDKITTMPTSSTLLLGGKFGKQGENTTSAPTASLARVE